MKTPAHRFDPKRISIHAVELAPDVPEWVHLIPNGVFAGRDGRGPYELRDPQAVITATDAYRDGDPLPIDRGHALEEMVSGTGRFGAEAYGWIVALEAREDGLWGQVEWTDDGAKAVGGRAFRFLSPVFAYADDGQVLALLRAGLTNLPNLAALTAINSAGAPAGGEQAMSDSLKAAMAAIAAMVGLPDSSDEATVRNAVHSIVESEKIHREGFEQLRGTLKLEAKTEPGAVLTAVNAQLASTQPDPAKYVPAAMHAQVAGQLKKLQEREGQRLVDELIEAGKIAPAQREWALAYHAQDPAGFEKFASTAPVVVEGGRDTRGSQQKEGTSSLDEAAKAVCAALGISETDYAKNVNQG